MLDDDYCITPIRLVIGTLRIRQDDYLPQLEPGRDRPVQEGQAPAIIHQRVDGGPDAGNASART
jgi:hypothetical protein